MRSVEKLVQWEPHYNEDLGNIKITLPVFCEMMLFNEYLNLQMVFMVFISLFIH